MMYPQVGRRYKVIPFEQEDPENWNGRIVTVTAVEYMPGTQDMYVARDEDGNEGAFWAADLVGFVERDPGPALLENGYPDFTPMMKAVARKEMELADAMGELAVALRAARHGPKEPHCKCPNCGYPYLTRDITEIEDNEEHKRLDIGVICCNCGKAPPRRGYIPMDV